MFTKRNEMDDLEKAFETMMGAMKKEALKALESRLFAEFVRRLMIHARSETITKILDEMSETMESEFINNSLSNSIDKRIIDETTEDIRHLFSGFREMIFKKYNQIVD